MFPYTLFSANVVVVLIFASTWGIDVASVLRWQFIALFLSNLSETWAKSTTTDAPSFTIIPTEPTEPPPFPLFPFDSNEDKET